MKTKDKEKKMSKVATIVWKKKKVAYFLTETMKARN